MNPAVKALLSDDPQQAEDIYKAASILQKFFRGGASALLQAAHGPEGAIDFLRLATTITGVMDPTPVSGIISSFAYPVYVPAASARAAPVESVVSSWDYLYAVKGSLLYYYRLEANGSWGAQGEIGSGWAGMRIVTAGDRGELYALDHQGELRRAGLPPPQPLVVVHAHVRMKPDQPGYALIHICSFERGRIAELWGVGMEIPAEVVNSDGVF